MDPGEYTLSGLKGAEENSIALQLYLCDKTGLKRYIYQFDEDVTFTIDDSTEAILHIRVYPLVEGIDLVARPAVYKDE